MNITINDTYVKDYDNVWFIPVPIIGLCILFYCWCCILFRNVDK